MHNIITGQYIPPAKYYTA